VNKNKGSQVNWNKVTFLGMRLPVEIMIGDIILSSSIYWKKVECGDKQECPSEGLLVVVQQQQQKKLKTKGRNSSMLLQKYSGKHYAGDELWGITLII